MERTQVPRRTLKLAKPVQWQLLYSFYKKLCSLLCGGLASPGPSSPSLHFFLEDWAPPSLPLWSPAFRPQQVPERDTLQRDPAGDQGCGSPVKQLAHLLCQHTNDVLLSLSFPWGEGRVLEDESLELCSLVFHNLKLQEPYSGAPDTTSMRQMSCRRPHYLSWSNSFIHGRKLGKLFSKHLWLQTTAGNLAWTPGIHHNFPEEIHWDPPWRCWGPSLFPLCGPPMGRL